MDQTIDYVPHCYIHKSNFKNTIRVFIRAMKSRTVISAMRRKKCHCHREFLRDYPYLINFKISSNQAKENI